MDLNQYNYQCYYSYLQNQSLPISENSQNSPQYVMYRPPHTSENFQNPSQYVMCPPPPLTSENSQNPPQYAMYTPPPHMWYMYPSSNVEPPISGSSQNAQIYSLPSTGHNISWDAVEKAVKRIMTGEEAIEMRNRTKMLSHLAKGAIEEGGSSISELKASIGELSSLSH
ncbi:hypothetical protein JHK87_019316 [Glycine soja]|nr:hypothetical protein JHK87_019316 [Glycine soja]